MSYGLQLLEKTKELNVTYKNVWNEIERVREGFFNEDLYWNTDKCYVPYLLADYLFNNIYRAEIENKDIQEIDIDLTWLTILSSWRRNKQIYNFNKLFSDSVIKENMDFDLNTIPTLDMFATLPYSNFFVYYPMFFENWGNSEGFFVSWDYNYEAKIVAQAIEDMEILLVITFIIDNEPVQFKIFFKDLSFRRLIQQYNQDCKNYTYYRITHNLTEKIDSGHFDEYTAKMQVCNRENIYKALLLVMYLNDNNKKKTENHKVIKNISDTDKLLKMVNINDKPDEIQNWEVNKNGIEWVQFERHNVISVDADTMLQSGIERNTPAEYKKGTPKAPHTRKGHIMRYWVGSKKNPGERKLEEKWIPERQINVKSHEDLLITENEMI